MRILDLDDDSNLELASAGGPGVLAFISSNPQRLEGRDFALSKPLRGQDFLQLLQRLESVVSS
ncbi:MAG: hypothetical protein Q7T36_10825 [Fluviicoccus sp.]|nr:hypothetical protein [Fluviicoccus sp.]